MPTKCLPKKRKLIIISSDDEGLSPAPESPQKAPLVSRITRSNSNNPNLPQHSYGGDALPSVSVAGRSVSATSITTPSLEKTLPLHSIPNLPTTSQHEDLDDLIEDGFSDNDAVSDSVGSSKYISSESLLRASYSSSIICGSKRSPVGLRGSQTKTKTGSGNSSHGASLGPRNLVLFPPFTDPSAVKIKTVVPNPCPWPERFSPKSPADLAVNPKKVSEVKSWLEHVLDGFSKKRMLILKGAAGVGKTATIDVLSNELGFEVLEWKNPSGAIRGDAYGAEGAFNIGLTGIFEEFVGRACKFGSLEMISTTSTSAGVKSSPQSICSVTGGSKRKVILIEEFPSTLLTSSPAPLASFRHTIKSFLATPTALRTSPPPPPLVLIISESAIVTGPGAFTAHRLLSPDILHHPLATTITFNKIAPTFMLNALSRIMTQESHESGRKFGPSKPLMEALTTTGDIRSAIMGLEFLAVDGEHGAFSERFLSTKKKKQKLGDGKLNELEKKMLMGVNQRESRLGVFHAVGKVVHNKRYGDDADDPYVPSPPKPLLDIHPYKSRASRVDINSLMDEAGTDAQTLISGLHENYLGSCNFLGGFSRRTHSLEDLLSCVNDCIGDLSDSDILASPRPYNNNFRAGSGGSNYQGSEGSAGTAGIRQDEISFQTAVRGVMIALPSPVKRNVKDNKMFFPTNLKLWREREEIEGVVDLLIGKFQRSGEQHMTGISILGTRRTDMVLERLPYLKVILEGHQRKRSEQGPYSMGLFETTNGIRCEAMRELEKVTVLRGISVPNEDVPDEQFTEVPDELETAEGRKRVARTAPKDPLTAKSREKSKVNVVEILDITAIGGLVLSDDDIEDNW